MSTHDEVPMGSGSGASRRSVLKTAAWSVPVITVMTAAPAFAASTDPWAISSASFEGTSAGVRDNNATYQFRFTLTIPAAATVTAPQCLMSFAASPGNGVTITGISATGSGTVDGWAYQGTDNVGTSANAYRNFTFTRGDVSGGPAAPTSVTLNFQMNQVGGSDADASTAATFSSTNSTTGPLTSFQILAANVDNYITSPHV